MIQTKPHFNDEANIALEFYKQIVQAMRSDGIRKILVTVGKDGNLEVNIAKQTIRVCTRNRGGTYACKQFSS